MKTSLLAKSAAGMVASLLCMACNFSETSVPSAGGDPSPVTAQKPPVAKLTPVASLTLPSGNELEFYELGNSAMVSETGLAGRDPSQRLSENQGPEGLVKVWTEFAGGKPVPKALSDLQNRLLTHKAPAPREKLLPSESFRAGEPLYPALTNEALAKSAGNICNDYYWISNVSACAPGWGGASWFLWNYGYSVINYMDIIRTNTFVCAASGTSIWTVYVDGKGGTWSIPEGYWRTFNWSAGWFDENFWSSVNSASYQRAHTYCGWVH